MASRRRYKTWHLTDQPCTESPKRGLRRGARVRHTCGGRGSLWQNRLWRPAHMAHVGKQQLFSTALYKHHGVRGSGTRVRTKGAYYLFFCYCCWEVGSKDREEDRLFWVHFYVLVNIWGRKKKDQRSTIFLKVIFWSETKCLGEGSDGGVRTRQTISLMRNKSESVGSKLKFFWGGSNKKISIFFWVYFIVFFFQKTRIKICCQNFLKTKNQVGLEYQDRSPAQWQCVIWPTSFHRAITP